MAGRARAAVERMGVTVPRLSIRDAAHLTDAEFAEIDALCEGPFWKASHHEPLARHMVEPGMEVVLFRDDHDTLVGLTMVTVDRIDVEGRPAVAFSVLDTYLRPAMRHPEQAAMAYAVLSMRELVRNRGRAVYAVMPTGTYHGYELVTHTLATFYPRPGQEPPPREQAILAAVAEKRFAEHLGPLIAGCWSTRRTSPPRSWRSRRSAWPTPWSRSSPSATPATGKVRCSCASRASPGTSRCATSSGGRPPAGKRRRRSTPAAARTLRMPGKDLETHLLPSVVRLRGDHGLLLVADFSPRLPAAA